MLMYWKIACQIVSRGLAFLWLSRKGTVKPLYLVQWDVSPYTFTVDFYVTEQPRTEPSTAETPVPAFLSVVDQLQPVEVEHAHEK